MKDLSVFKQFTKQSKSIQFKTDGKAVIYTRVSTKEQADNNASLETQLKYCKEYALKKNIEVAQYFGGTYESAKSDERKQFQKMLTFVKRRNDIGYIIVYSYDRFSRTGANGAYISDQLKKQGIVTISATQEVDTSTSAGSFQQNLYYMFSQFDNELRRDKIMTGMREKLRKGHWTGSLPFGYNNLNPGAGKTPNYVINEKGKLLKQGFLWKVNNNMSHVEIAKRLKRKGLNSITAKKLSKYFRNPFYCGLIISSIIPDEVIEGSQEAMISKKEFLKIHDLLRSRSDGNKYTLDDENLPLKMFLRSAICDTPYTGYIVKKKGLYYYKNRRIGSKENRSAKKLHLSFLTHLERFQVKDEKLIEPLKIIIKEKFLALNKDAITDSKRYENDILTIEKKLNRLEERFVFEEISKEQYNRFRRILQKDKDEILKLTYQTGFNSSNLNKAIEKGLKLAVNLSLLWQSGDIETKRKLQYMLFPEGIKYDLKNDSFRTTRINSIFKAISVISTDSGENKNGILHKKNEESLSVERKGFEPSKRY